MNGWYNTMQYMEWEHNNHHNCDCDWLDFNNCDCDYGCTNIHDCDCIVNECDECDCMNNECNIIIYPMNRGE